MSSLVGKAIADMLPEGAPNPFPIICGTSAGAVLAAVLASHAKRFRGGIVALEALRYGCVPLVRRTGGLNDIVEDFDPATKTGNGFSFTAYDPWAFYGTVVSALTTYRDPDCWRRLVQNCLRCDFSWDHSAREYEELYRFLLK